MTEEQLMNKMRGSAEEYRELIHNRQYVRAVNLYNEVRAVAVYVELPEDRLEELFGKYDPEDKNVQNGLFPLRFSSSSCLRALSATEVTFLRSNRYTIKYTPAARITEIPRQITLEWISAYSP